MDHHNSSPLYLGSSSPTYITMMKIAVAVLALCAMAYGQDESVCKDVAPAAGFKVSQFVGVWYEVGNIKSTGASIFDDGCQCSRSNMTLDSEGAAEGDATYNYACNLDAPDGDVSVFDTVLREMSPAGKWKQEVVPLFDPHNFVVVHMGDDYALTYRCGDYVLAESYTVQFLSRKPSMQSANLEKLQAKVTELGLNPENAEYKSIPHSDQCMYN